jgi:hypothetical protein
MSSTSPSSTFRSDFNKATNTVVAAMAFIVCLAWMIVSLFGMDDWFIVWHG